MSRTGPRLRHVGERADLGGKLGKMWADYKVERLRRLLPTASKPAPPEEVWWRPPNRPNLRQALLVDADVFIELAQQDIHIVPGMLGENIAIEGIDVMQLPEKTRLAIGSAVVEGVERRNPYLQLNGINPRLLKAVVKKQPGKTFFKACVMTRILQSGWVRAGDLVEVLAPVEILRVAQDDTLRTCSKSPT
jgi:hypothetical protein